MQLSSRQQDIIDIIATQEQASISKIKDLLQDSLSVPTLNRQLAVLVAENYLLKIGKGRSITYKVSPFYRLFAPLSTTDYFDKEPDARGAITSFNFDLLPMLKSTDLLTSDEKKAHGRTKEGVSE